MGVHFRKEIKWQQVVSVLAVAFFLVFLIDDFDWWRSVKTYTLLMVVTAIFAVVSLGTLYLISSMAKVSGLKEGTTVTADRDTAIQQHSHKKKH